MDSDNLKGFYDGFVEYEIESSYWSHKNDCLDLQLTETLSGILPISPERVKQHCFDNDSTLVFNESYANYNLIDNSEAYEDAYSILESTSSPVVEVVSVDPNCEYDSSMCSDEEEILEDCGKRIENDSIYNCNGTESSLFEGNDSQNDDENKSDEDETNNINIQNDITELKLQKIKITNITKMPKIEFIAHDKDKSQKPLKADNVKNVTTAVSNESNKTQVFPLNNVENEKVVQSKTEDSDVDFDVDVETVNDNENNFDWTIRKDLNVKHIDVEDDLIKDPSWNPYGEKIKKMNTQNSKKEKPKVKSTVEKLKSMKNAKTKPSVTILLRKAYETGRKHTASLKANLGNKSSSNGNNLKNSVTCKTPMITEKISSEKKNSTNLNIQKSSSTFIKEEQKNSSTLLSNEQIKIPIIQAPVKKKLNLEEYKKRRGVSSAGGDVINISSVNVSSEMKSLQNNETTKQPVNPKQMDNLNTVKQNPLSIPSPAKEMILKKLEKTPLDPITEAKNKVLRLKELKKKAALDRIIDSTVSAKVGPVTTILPLEEIVRGSTKKEEKSPIKLNSCEYDEIIFLSIGLNTEISIPPSFKMTKKNSLFYNIPDTLGRSNYLEDVRITNCSLISSIQDVALKKLGNLTSITETDINKQSDSLNIENKCDSEVLNLEHGEDKTIVHLRKDRIRSAKRSSSTQTIILPQFPPLQCASLLSEKKMKTAEKLIYPPRSTSYSSDDNDDSYHSSSNSLHSSNRSYRSSSKKEIHQSSRSLDSSYERRFISGDSSSSEFTKERPNRSPERRKRRYSSTSTDNSSSTDRSTSNASERSNESKFSHISSPSRRRFSPRSYSKSNKGKNRKSRSNGNRCREDVSLAIEERRIVYVGRIEKETSEEDLKRKFLPYGSISDITFHYRNNGMKFGFVTFERAEDAFQAIDNGTKDQNISMYDVSFGGRRAFCGTLYADLDGEATNSFQMYSYPSVMKIPKNNVENDSFEALLAKVKQELTNKKSSSDTLRCSKM